MHNDGMISPPLNQKPRQMKVSNPLIAKSHDTLGCASMWLSISPPEPVSLHHPNTETNVAMIRPPTTTHR